MSEIKISYYFNYDSRGHSSRDQQKIKQIRAKLNNFKDVKDQYAWLEQRRRSRFARDEDFRLFGISQSLEIPKNPVSEENRYYKEQEEVMSDYFKRDKEGNILTDKYGRNKEYGRLGKKLVNFQNNVKNTNLSRKLGFIIKNLKAILWISGIISLLLTILTVLIFALGIAGSVGHTPFILCGHDDIKPAMPNSKDVNEMASPDYGKKVFIAYAKSKNWKKEAIIGVLSYILQEGNASGTFTYESDFVVRGPGGKLKDTTLDNKDWIKWLNDKKTHEESISKNPNNYNWNHHAIGLGLVQFSDVWENGTKTVDNATKMLEFAESKGKPWQDPETQMEYLWQRFSEPGAFDTNDVDPTSSNKSAEEWARRVTAGIGMPGWNWTDNNSYMSQHTAHLEEAEKAYNDFAGGSDIKALGGGVSHKLCKNMIGSNSAIAGNGSIADAAVSIASGDGEESKIMFDMRGSESPHLNDQRLAVYKRVKMAIFGDDPYFASCDRTAATAIRWSGADDDFPIGPTALQYSYMSNSPKWKDMGNWGSVDLQPGDVLITRGDGHIKVYVGEEAAQKRFPGTKSQMVQGSIDQYFPSLGYDVPGYDNRTFAVFRCVKPDNSDKYKNV